MIVSALLIYFRRVRGTNVKSRLGTIHAEFCRYASTLRVNSPRMIPITPRVTRVTPVRVIAVPTTVHDTEMAVRLQHDSVNVRQRHTNLTASNSPVSLPERHITRDCCLTCGLVTARRFSVGCANRCRRGERERERRTSGKRSHHSVFFNMLTLPYVNHLLLQLAPPTKTRTGARRTRTNAHSPLFPSRVSNTA